MLLIYYLAVSVHTIHMSYIFTTYSNYLKCFCIRCTFLSSLLSSLLSSFFSSLLSFYDHLLFFSIYLLIKFAVLYIIILFVNVIAYLIYITSVFTEFGLSFCFNKCFCNVLLSTIWISMSPALCIIISWYPLSIQCMIYCISITFIIAVMNSL